jgi:O-antigen/teichoic acid export membrane protein
MSDPRPPDSGTPGEPDVAELGISRTRGSVSFIVARAISACFNLISVPILMSLLGDYPYSAIVFTLYIQNLMSCFDLGITEVSMRQMSVAITARDDEEFQNLNRDQFTMNLISGFVMILVGLVCGALIDLTDSGVGRIETLVLFAGIGIQSALNRLSLSVITPLSAYQRFDRVSLALALQGIVTTVLAIALAYLTHRPWTYAIAIVVAEAIAFIVLATAARKLGRWKFPRAAFRPERLKPLLRLCLVDYPNRVGSFFTAAGDKLLLGAAGARARLDAVDYRNGSRLPDVLKEMLIVFGVTSLPTFSRDFHQSRETFHQGVLFSGSVVFFASCLAMLVPAGFADPLLRVWLGRFYVPDGALVMLLMAFFQALQSYVMIMGYAFFAMAKRGWFIPITLGGAAASLLLTVPIYHRYGIIGVAAMNAAIGGAQLLGLWITLIRLEYSFKEVLHHGLRVM